MEGAREVQLNYGPLKWVILVQSVAQYDFFRNESHLD